MKTNKNPYPALVSRAFVILAAVFSAVFVRAEEENNNDTVNTTYSVDIDSPSDGDIFLMDSGETASGTATEVDEDGSSDVSADIVWSIGDDDMGSGSTSEDFTMDSGAITLTATIDDGNPSGDETASIDVTVYDIEITGPDSTLDGASASFGVQVKDPSDENPDSFKWTYEVPSGAGWLPDGNVFSDDTAESPSVGKAHWFAYPDQNDAGFTATYTIEVEVGFGGKKLLVTKEWNVPMSDDSREWLGKVPRPRITGLPQVQSYTAANGSTKWRVGPGDGTLSRNSPTNSDIEIYVHANSQWRDKTQVHEEKHVEQWTTGGWSAQNGWFSLSELREDYLDDIDDDYGSKAALISKIEENIRWYNNSENRAANDTSDQRETEARAAASGIDPPYWN